MVTTDWHTDVRNRNLMSLNTAQYHNTDGANDNRKIQNIAFILRDCLGVQLPVPGVFPG